jgi:hypothetical protein
MDVKKVLAQSWGINYPFFVNVRMSVNVRTVAVC